MEDGSVEDGWRKMGRAAPRPWWWGRVVGARSGESRDRSASQACDPMDCSLPGSSVPGISPGKNSGVGCHFAMLQSPVVVEQTNTQACSLHTRVLSWGPNLLFSDLCPVSGEGNGTPLQYSSTLASKIPWTEEPGGLQSMGLLRVKRGADSEKQGCPPALGKGPQWRRHQVNFLVRPASS